MDTFKDISEDRNLALTYRSQTSGNLDSRPRSNTRESVSGLTPPRMKHRGEVREVMHHDGTYPHFSDPPNRVANELADVLDYFKRPTDYRVVDNRHLFDVVKVLMTLCVITSCRYLFCHFDILIAFRVVIFTIGLRITTMTPLSVINNLANYRKTLIMLLFLFSLPFVQCAGIKMAPGYKAVKSESGAITAIQRVSDGVNFPFPRIGLDFFTTLPRTEDLCKKSCMTIGSKPVTHCHCYYQVDKTLYELDKCRGHSYMVDLPWMYDDENNLMIAGEPCRESYSPTFGDYDHTSLAEALAHDTSWFLSNDTMSIDGFMGKTHFATTSNTVTMVWLMLFLFLFMLGFKSYTQNPPMLYKVIVATLAAIFLYYGICGLGYSYYTAVLISGIVFSNVIHDNSVSKADFSVFQTYTVISIVILCLDLIAIYTEYVWIHSLVFMFGGIFFLSILYSIMYTHDIFTKAYLFVILIMIGRFFMAVPLYCMYHSDENYFSNSTMFLLELLTILMDAFFLNRTAISSAVYSAGEILMSFDRNFVGWTCYLLNYRRFLLVILTIFSYVSIFHMVCAMISFSVPVKRKTYVQWVVQTFFKAPVNIFKSLLKISDVKKPTFLVLASILIGVMVECYMVLFAFDLLCLQMLGLFTLKLYPIQGLQSTEYQTRKSAGVTEQVYQDIMQKHVRIVNKTPTSTTIGSGFRHHNGIYTVKHVIEEAGDIFVDGRHVDLAKDFTVSVLAQNNGRDGLIADSAVCIVEAGKATAIEPLDLNVVKEIAMYSDMSKKIMTTTDFSYSGNSVSYKLQTQPGDSGSGVYALIGEHPQKAIPIAVHSQAVPCANSWSFGVSLKPRAKHESIQIGVFGDIVKEFVAEDYKELPAFLRKNVEFDPNMIKIMGSAESEIENFFKLYFLPQRPNVEVKYTGLYNRIVKMIEGIAPEVLSDERVMRELKGAWDGIGNDPYKASIFFKHLSRIFE